MTVMTWRLSEDEARETFKQIRWSATNGEPVCPRYRKEVTMLDNELDQELSDRSFPRGII